MSVVNNQVGVVVIGRNEGSRLIRSLASLAEQSDRIVYVDSGSTDDSVQQAIALGTHVVQMDLSKPFTASRARNAGFAALVEQWPDITKVQFVDGDCQILPDWLADASAALDQDPKRVAVCGWGREIHPEHSVYNRICQVEWRMGSAGEVGAFGGLVMIQRAAFEAVGGFDDAVVAAEDDELAFRLRGNGGVIFKLDRDCFAHDANILRFGQWWKRAQRSGYAYAQVSSMHGLGPEKKFVKELKRTNVWGMVAPAVAVVGAPFTRGLSLGVLARYPVVAARATRVAQGRGSSLADSMAWGISCAFAVFPQVVGAQQFFRNRRRGQTHQMIEYKTTAVTNKESL
jgi:glycosyltransferase involved in cell wall biosynthesis